MFEQILASFFTPQFVVFCVIIYLLVAGLRKAIEAVAVKLAPAFPDKYEPFWTWLWREFLLPMAPIVTGGALAYFVTQYPYPEIFNGDAARLFYGVFCGLVSGYVYPRVKYYLETFAPKAVDKTVEDVTK